jgi:hypothetical protein
VRGSQLGTGIAATLATQPVRGSQLGTGIALEMAKLGTEFRDVVGCEVTAPATKPVKTIEKMDACTKSFMIWLPPSLTAFALY